MKKYFKTYMRARTFHDEFQFPKLKKNESNTFTNHTAKVF